MKALSIRQPWAWLIVHGHKGLENRNWNTTQRGRILIHAPKTLDREAWDLIRHLGIPAPEPENIETGGLVGRATIKGVVTESKSIWFQGPFAFVLADPEAFVEMIPCRGSLGFFRPPVQQEQA